LPRHKHKTQKWQVLYILIALEKYSTHEIFRPNPKYRPMRHIHNRNGNGRQFTVYIETEGKCRVTSKRPRPFLPTFLQIHHLPVYYPNYTLQCNGSHNTNHIRYDVNSRHQYSCSVWGTAVPWTTKILLYQSLLKGKLEN